MMLTWSWTLVSNESCWGLKSTTKQGFQSPAFIPLPSICNESFCCYRGTRVLSSATFVKSSYRRDFITDVKKVWVNICRTAVPSIFLNFWQTIFLWACCSTWFVLRYNPLWVAPVFNMVNEHCVARTLGWRLWTRKYHYRLSVVVGLRRGTAGMKLDKWRMRTIEV